MNATTKALMVMVMTKSTRQYLARYDLKALEQAERALLKEGAVKVCGCVGRSKIAEASCDDCHGIGLTAFKRRDAHTYIQNVTLL